LAFLNDIVDWINWFYSQWWGYGIIVLALFFGAVNAWIGAIWAYKDSNKQIFSKEFSGAAIYSAFLVWIFFFAQ
jgi:hypothetical protein